MCLEKMVEQIDIFGEFYNLIRSENVSQLEDLFNQEHQDDVNFSEALAEAYEAIKMYNVPVSEEMEYKVVSLLLSSRFFSENNDENRLDVKINLDEIKIRIDIIISLLDRCITKATNRHVDDGFIYTAILISTQIHLVKRYLQATYNRIPWEEIEFCLLHYISTVIIPKEADEISKLVLRKDRILDHLVNFKESLVSLRETIICAQDLVVNKRELNRTEVMISVINFNSKFEELYDDYNFLKDVYSLTRVSSYIKECLKLDWSSDSSSNKSLNKYVIERTLQVVGEFLNDSVQSPNVSPGAKILLFSKSPYKLRQIFIKIRHALAHADILPWKTSIENDDTTDLFKNLQNDFGKIFSTINDALLRRRQTAIINFLNQIIRCNNLETVKRWGREIRKIDVKNLTRDVLSSNEIRALKLFMSDLRKSVNVVTCSENQLLDKIDEIFTKQETKLVQKADEYKNHSNSIMLCLDALLRNNNLEQIHAKCKNALLQCISLRQDENELKTINKLLNELENNLKLYPPNDDIVVANKCITLIRSIFYTYSERTNEIDKFHNGIENAKKVTTKLISNYVDSIIKSFTERIDSLVQEKIKTCYDSAKDLNWKKQKLVSLLISKKQTADNDEECIALYKSFNFNSKLNERFEKQFRENCTRCLEIVSKINDPYGALLKQIGELNRFMTDSQADAFKTFLKTFKIKSINVDEVRPVLNENVCSHYCHKINCLKDILSCNDDDDDYNNNNTSVIFNRFTKCKKIQVGVELLLLDILNILQISNRLADNSLYLDVSCPILNGRMLRNYLAHGSVLVDTLPFVALKAIICNALKFIKEGQQLLSNSNCLIGQKVLPNINNTKIRIDTLLKYSDNQLKYFDYAKTRTVEDLKEIVDIELLTRNFINWSLLHISAMGDNIDTFKFLINNNLSVNSASKYNQKPIHCTVINGSKKVIKYILENTSIPIPVYNTLFINLSGYGHSEIIEMLLAHKPNISKIIPSKALIRAVTNGHSNTAELLINHGADVNYQSETLNTPLHYASEFGHADSARILLKNGADVKCKGFKQSTPLISACHNGNKEVIEVLLEYGATIECKTDGDIQPLQIAVSNNNKDLINFLIDKGANVNHSDKDLNLTALHYAVHNGHEEAAVALLAAKADVNLKSSIGHTLLMSAAKKGFESLVDLLIQYDADVNAEDNKGWTALHCAAEEGHEDILCRLIQKGAKVNTSAEHESPLFLACQNGHVSATVTLLKNGAEVNNVSSSYIPLFAAVQFNHPEIVNLLLEAKADTTVCSDKGVFLIHFAARFGNTEIMRHCLENCDNPNPVDLNSNTALLFAAISGNLESVTLLLNKTGNINHENKFGYTALHLAVQSNHMEIVKCLLDYGAGVNKMTKNHLTALVMAARCDYSDISETLLEKGAKINAHAEISECELSVERCQGLALHTAIQFDSEKTFDMLLENGADINYGKQCSATPLHIAAQTGHANMAKKLVHKGAPIDFEGDSAPSLIIASKFGHLQVVRFLLSKGANVNAQTDTKLTALYVSIMAGHFEIVSELLKYNADVLHETSDSSILHASVWSKNMDIIESVVERITEKGVEFLDVQNRTGETALMMCAGPDKINYEIAALLISNGADVNFVNSLKMYPLFKAVIKGHYELVLKLLNSGADVFDNGDYTVVHGAVFSKNRKILQVIIEKVREIDINFIDKADFRGDTPLMWCAKHGSDFCEAAQVLLLNGADVNALNKENKNALQLAQENNNVEFLNVLENYKTNS